MTSIDLTEQFVRDYEELRRLVESRTDDGAIEAERHRFAAEAERLEALNRELLGQLATSRASLAKRNGMIRELEARTQQADQTRADGEELRERSNQLAEALKRERARRNQEVERKEEAIHRLTEELGVQRREIDELRKRAAARPTAAHIARQERAIRDQVLGEVRPALARLAHLPLRPRLAAFVVDAALAVAAVRWVGSSASEWFEADGASFLAMVLGLFALRALVSPGRILLGISPRRIGPDSIPKGSAGLLERFICGLLHYSPLMAVAAVVGSDRPALDALANLPERLGQVGGPTELWTLALGVRERISPEAGFAIALGAAWAACLMVSLLTSRWVFRDAPHHWNTTFIETMCGVGFERFRWPKWLLPEDERALGGGG